MNCIITDNTFCLARINADGLLDPPAQALCAASCQAHPKEPEQYPWGCPQDKRLEMNPILASSKLSAGCLTFFSLFLLLCKAIPLYFI